MRIGIRMVAIFTLGAAFALSGCDRSGSTGVDSGRRAPEIVGDEIRGDRIQLSQYRGKVVLIDFWATWCPPCRALIPHEKDLHRQYDTRPFVTLGISADRTREALRSFVERERLPWPNIFDENSVICRDWNIEAFPTFVLVDHEGVIIDRWIGGGHMDEIEQAIEKAVREAEKNQRP